MLKKGARRVSYPAGSHKGSFVHYLAMIWPSVALAFAVFCVVILSSSYYSFQ